MPRKDCTVARLGSGVTSCLFCVVICTFTQCDRTLRPMSSSSPSTSVAAGPPSAKIDSTEPPPVSPCKAAISQTDRAARLQWLRNEVLKAVERFEKVWSDGAGGLVCPSGDHPSKKGSIHEWGDYAFAKIVLSGGGDASARSLAEAALRCLMTFENLGPPGDPDRGVFPFHYGDHPNPRDNPTEFALSPVAGLFATSPPSPALRAELEPSLVRALDAIERHSVCPKYTNICLLQTADLLSLGGVLTQSDNPATHEFGEARVASGKAHLTRWLAFTRSAGIAEFDSPTYYETDLVALVLALRGTEDEWVHTKLREALDYFWSDIAANFFSGRSSLAGSHSRTYSFFGGQGAIALPLYLEGLRGEAPTPADLNAGLLAATVELLNGEQGVYRPPARARCLSSVAEREIVSTFGPDNGAGGRQRYAFVTPDFAIGSASADYGTIESDQDEVIRAELPSSTETSAVVVLADYLDSPGATVKSGDFNKITHLPMSPAAAQNKGAMLVLLRVPAASPKYHRADGVELPLVNLATNVIVPADADEILVDGRTADREHDVTLGARPTLVLRMGTGVVAVSVIGAGGIECPGADEVRVERHPPTLHFKPLERATDGHGPTARLVIYHDCELPSDPSALSRCFARTALVFVGERCSDRRCATDLFGRVAAANKAAATSFDERTGDWDVRVHVTGAADRHVHRIVGKGEEVLAREVDGREVVFAPLQVNGRTVPLE
jgi:hypothetical protein